VNPALLYLPGFTCVVLGAGFLLATGQHFLACPPQDRFEKWAPHWLYWWPALAFIGAGALLIGVGRGLTP
jgi:hypothetical protein